MYGPWCVLIIRVCLLVKLTVATHTMASSYKRVKLYRLNTNDAETPEINGRNRTVLVSSSHHFPFTGMSIALGDLLWGPCIGNSEHSSGQVQDMISGCTAEVYLQCSTKFATDSFDFENTTMENQCSKNVNYIRLNKTLINKSLDVRNCSSTKTPQR